MRLKLEHGEDILVQAIRVNGCLGDEVLIISDQGALQVSMAGHALSVSQPPTTNSAMPQLLERLEAVRCLVSGPCDADQAKAAWLELDFVIAQLRQ